MTVDLQSVKMTLGWDTHGTASWPKNESAIQMVVHMAIQWLVHLMLRKAYQQFTAQSIPIDKVDSSIERRFIGMRKAHDCVRNQSR